MGSKSVGIVLCTVVYLLVPHIAYAYVDPGAGSYIMQVLLASLITVPFVVKMLWRKAFVKKECKEQTTDKSDED
ncbi:MAG: hypothetical protein HPY55_08420 [Firmicutes bacterium]|nr:hypothetical protein [Bacillota bacterium]